MTPPDTSTDTEPCGTEARTCAIPASDPVHGQHLRGAHAAEPCKGIPSSPCGGTCVNCVHAAHLWLKGTRPTGVDCPCGGTQRCKDAKRWQDAWAHVTVTSRKELAEALDRVETLAVALGADRTPAELAHIAEGIAAQFNAAEAQAQKDRAAYLTYVTGIHEIEQAIAKGLTFEDAWKVLAKVRDRATAKFTAARPAPKPAAEVLARLATPTSP